MLKLIAIITALAGGQSTVLEHKDHFETKAACEAVATEKRPVVVEYLKTLYGADEGTDYTLEFRCLPTGERTGSN